MYLVRKGGYSDPFNPFLFCEVISEKTIWENIDPNIKISSAILIFSFVDFMLTTQNNKSSNAANTAFLIIGSG